MAMTIADVLMMVFILILVGFCFAGLIGMGTWRRKHHSDKVIKHYKEQVDDLCKESKCDPSKLIKLFEEIEFDKDVDMKELHQQTINAVVRRVNK